MELPVVVGLHVCERVTLDPVTGGRTLWNRFTHLASDVFPTAGMDFSIQTFLINGFGTLALRVEIFRLATGDVVYEFPAMQPFIDRLEEVPFHLRLSNVVFPHPGGYEICLTNRWLSVEFNCSNTGGTIHE